MKYAIIIPDGCADEPQESLGGKTPLEAARLPSMDAVAVAGIVGKSNNTPESLPAGSDTANLSLLGYSPLEHFTGRAPLEAAAQGIELGPGDWAVRCNLVTIENQVMREFTAGHISSAEAAELIEAVQSRLGSEHLQFCPGVSYRNLLVVRAAEHPAPFSQDTRTTPPHDLTDQSVLDAYPRGPGSDLLTRLMSESEAIFADHPVNVARRRRGELPATNIWLWGQGSAPKLTPFVDRYGVNGAMITAVDLLRGLARLMGWRRIDVPGATGYIDTDYEGKTAAALQALRDGLDFVYLHIEAPDECGHRGEAANKVRAIEDIDRRVLAPLLTALDGSGEAYRVLVMPDHPTPLSLRTHTREPVPYLLYGAGIPASGAPGFTEAIARDGGVFEAEGFRLAPRLFAQ